MDAEFVKEVLEFVRGLELSNLELLLAFVFVLVMWRLPVILRHRREVVAARDKFALRSQKTQAKIADERDKRQRRLAKR